MDRSQVERRAQEGNRAARRVSASLRNLSFELSGAQLGITATSLVVGAIAQPVIARLIEPLIMRVPLVPPRSSLTVSLTLALALATGTQMVFGELVPKNLAIARPYQSAVMFGIPMQVVNQLLRPLIRFLNNAANWTVRRLGVEPREELAGVRSIWEMELMIRSAAEHGHLDDDELKLLTRTITFSEKVVAGDAMVPRVHVIGLSCHDSITRLRRLAQETGHSRFPVYDEGIDDITGIAHVKDTFSIPSGRRSTVPVAQVTRSAVRAPESQPLGQLLIELQTGGHHMAVVVDEYGGTAGIITIEDLLEEIVGEIADEHDIEPKPAPSGGGNEVVLGLLHRHEVEELTGFVWPEGRYDTLGGFLVARLGRFPSPGELVHVGPWTFEIVRMDGYRIDRVIVHRPKPDDPEESVR